MPNKLDETIQNKILEEAKEGKLSCGKCMKIAEELNSSLLKVGKNVEALDIKIISCQLGCF
ncbi:hypothetical protein [Natranaerobius trueperi]|uniref:Uncharacterized protein n=1 Tax=Natranaerobius trueperi TaxID=759412 RepID=A0A226C0Q3_9FIRM|nr:hypothetical protein [Natranaerobius trueperi]OWZ84755.1 hypothetical protein CDO51_01675 [Natranaerobius trueperi]